MLVHDSQLLNLCLLRLMGNVVELFQLSVLFIYID